jgi:hypothetical protein
MELLDSSLLLQVAVVRQVVGRGMRAAGLEN